MTGDQPDVLKRLKAVLPPWFGSLTPVLDGVLTGFAYTGSFLYSLYAYAKKQTRILTSTEGWLDMVAGDFFGTSLLRAQGQTDASFLARIRANLLREKGTRNAIIRVLYDLTGRTPIVFESERPLDTGAWNNSSNLALGLTGAYGSLIMPFEALIKAFRPLGSGIPYVNGYGQPAGGYNIASRSEYASLADIQGAITDADIYAAVNSVRPVATTMWTSIQS